MFSSLFLVACTAMNEDKTEVNDEVTVDVAAPKYDYLVLVNKQHKLPEDWEANVELVEVQNAYDETIRVEKEALEKYNELRDTLLKEGVDIELDSAYRSVSKQEEVWKDFEEEKGLEYTQKYVAVPWYSEHHTALAIDICIKKDWVLIYENEDMIAEPEIFAKVHEKLADYGFILRYLDGKEDITWYGYEPWHLRYVRDVEIAKEIMDNGLTLEEYLEMKDSNKKVVETEEDRIAACEDTAGFYLNFGSWEFDWEDEHEAWASFSRDWHVVYEKWWEKAETDVNCFIDMVDQSVNVEFSNQNYLWPIEE